ncbi:MAG: hypothetical protein NZM08_04505 [Chitinophagales bacterium]|nr:hypothetical protein [Chitinophagales bacterium]
MGEILFVLLTLYFLYRSYANMQKAARKEAEERRRRNEEVARRMRQEQQTARPLTTVDLPPTAGTERPTTLDDILKELMGEEPQPAPAAPRPKPKKPAAKKVPSDAPKTEPVKKKTQEPFLTADYQPEMLPEATASLDVPAPESTETLLKTEPFAPLVVPQRRRYPFNLRQAIIAKTILDRPEW